MKPEHTYQQKAAAWLTGLLLLASATTSAFAQRDTRSLNDGWRFRQGACTAARDSAFDDSRWTSIHLPHSWNADAYTEKAYYQGEGWYRRRLHLPDQWEGKRIILRLDGASKAVTLFVNGREVGEHAGGYTASAFDLTPYLSFHAPNVLALRVDNARQDIPPISGDFTFFGGIYRDVWLTAVPQQHFRLTDLGSESLFISTPRVSDEEGSVAIRGTVENGAAQQADLEVIFRLYDPDDRLLQTHKKKITLKGGESGDFRCETSLIPHPQLWTPETPRLYRVETLLVDRKTQAVLDRSERHTAFRWYHFDAGQGFSLNGRPYKLRGICRHQDQRPFGPALTDEMHRRDFLLMKEMGANFIRISHYPQDDALLEMCDRLGMLAWEEIPVIDIVPDTPGYADCCERNLREMIRQHYNHPSIILWGYMNEILLVTQRRYKGEAQQPVVARTLELARRLEQALKEEDPTRLSTMAFHGSDDYNRLGLSEITDVVGWNLYQGWYEGDLTGFERFLAGQHESQPGHPMIVSEYGAGSDRRLHSLRPQPFDFSTEYQQRYLEHYLPVLEQTPYVCGGTHWNFIDFCSALRDESMPRINNKGLVLNDRTPKDVYYYYQAMWRQEIPVLHIASRDWTHRAGLQQADGTPVVLPVKVYSNLPEVELFIDGQSVGKQRTENCTALFQVPFSSKEPFLRACGDYQGRRVEDGLRLHFTPLPARTQEKGLGTTELAINVGSHCFFTSDDSRLTWLPDQPYTPGNWGYIGGKEAGTQTEIHGTTDGPLFQTLRKELEGYRFDLPAGTYEVELLFADIDRKGASAVYLLGREGAEAEGQNHFSLSVNGQVLEADLLPAENGHFHALRRKYRITTEKPYLDLRFQAESGTCFLNGIKIRQLAN